MDNFESWSWLESKMRIKKVFLTSSSDDEPFFRSFLNQLSSKNKENYYSNNGSSWGSRPGPIQLDP